MGLSENATGGDHPAFDRKAQGCQFQDHGNIGSEREAPMYNLSLQFILASEGLDHG
jgi:hypothetical protein